MANRPEKKKIPPFLSIVLRSVATLALIPQLSTTPVLSQETGRKFQALLQEADKLYNEEGKVEAAREKWFEAAKLDPLDVRPHLLLAQSYEFEGYYEKIIPHLNRAAEIEPENSDIRRKIATALFRGKGKDQGIAYLRDSVKDFPEDADLHDTLAYYLFDAKRYAQAAAVYRKLSELNPESTFYPERLLECLLSNGNLDEGLEQLNAIVHSINKSENPRDQKRREIENVEQKYRNMLERTGHAEAILEYEIQRLEANPENHNHLIRLGDAYLSRGYGLLALSAHLQAAYQGKNADALAARAGRLAGEKRAVDAMLFFRAVMDHFPEHPGNLELVDSLVSLSGNKEARDIFDPGRAELYRLAEKACRRVARSKAPDEVRRRAEINAIYYHYLPLPHSETLGLQARELYSDLLTRDGHTTETRNTVNEQIRLIDDEWLNWEPKREEDKP